MTTTPTLWGSTITISSNSGAQDSSIAPLGDAGFAVAYEIYSTPAGGTSFLDVGGQAVSAFGALVGDDILKAASTGDKYRHSPEALLLGDGTLAVTYVRNRTQSDADPALALRDPPDFATGATSGRLLDSSTRNDDDLFETVSTRSGFATLYGRSSSTGDDELLLRRFKDDGALIGKTIDVDPSSVHQTAGDLTVLEDGATLVATWYTQPSSGVLKLWLRVFGGDGSPVTDALNFGATTRPFAPQVEALSGGGFVAAWQDIGDGGFYHQRFDESGVALGVETLEPAGVSYTPKIVTLDDGGYIIGWTQVNGTESDGSNQFDISLQRYDAAGAAVGGPLVIDPEGDQLLEDIQMLKDGRVAISYTSETGDATNDNELLAQIIDPRDEHIVGTPLADVIVGREDGSTIDGLDGADRLTGRGEEDVINGGPGSDTLTGNGGEDDLSGGIGSDSLSGVGASDTLSGGSSNDTLNGGDDGDELIGGTGLDTASYEGASAGVRADLQSAAGNTGDAAGDSYATIEYLTGSSFADTLGGNGSGNRLEGGDGGDELVGRGGNDDLSGGEGPDRFVFDYALGPANIDSIADVAVADDTIALDDTIFAGLSTGVLAAAAFKRNMNGTAGDASDRIICEVDTGNLYFDRDGTGGAYGAVQFATLANLVTISAADFVVI